MEQKITLKQFPSLKERRVSARSIVDHRGKMAGHYGFTEEELDFVINYDIKYRSGRDTEGKEE